MRWSGSLEGLKDSKGCNAEFEIAKIYGKKNNV